jgi:hypothetical protein
VLVFENGSAKLVCQCYGWVSHELHCYWWVILLLKHWLSWSGVILCRIRLCRVQTSVVVLCLFFKFLLEFLWFGQTHLAFIHVIGTETFSYPFLQFTFCSHSLFRSVKLRNWVSLPKFNNDARKGLKVVMTGLWKREFRFENILGQLGVSRTMWHGDMSFSLFTVFLYHYLSNTSFIFV